MELSAQNPDQLRDIIAGNAAEEIKLWDGRLVTSKIQTESLKGKRVDVTSNEPFINKDGKLLSKIGSLLKEGCSFSTRTRHPEKVTRIWTISE